VASGPRRGPEGAKASIGHALALSLEAGLFGWMALSQDVIWQPPLPIDSSSHWFMMQIGMTLGFLTSWPVYHWLLVRGMKEPMAHHARHPDVSVRRAAVARLET
jgi:hypothetical protein